MKLFTRLFVALVLCTFSVTLFAQGTYYFGTFVSFNPDFPDEYVEVTLACNSGIPLVQPAYISEEFGVTFTVEELFPGSECQVTQSPVEGYLTVYFANGVYSEEHCYFSGDNLLIANQCRIFNSGVAPNSRGSMYGYESIEQYGFVPGLSSEIIEARCSEGKKVLGGGWRFLSGGAWETGDIGPSPDGGGFYLSIGSLTEEPQEVLVTAICAFPSKK